MTWATTKDQGSGTLAWRLDVQRLPYGFVSHVSMIKAAATPPRINGLRVRGGKLKAQANIASGELDVSGLSVYLVDIGEQATAALATAPAKTWLTANVTSSATTMTVRSVAGFASSGRVWVDSECMTYSSTIASSNTIAGMTRGALGTVAQAHYIDAGGSLRYPAVTDGHSSLVGARATLYVYGENDDPQGDGTAVWRGIVSRPPTFSGASWKLSIDPITSALARAVSGDLADPVSPRGIYYTWNRPFYLRVFRKPNITSEPTLERYTYGTGDEGKVAFPVAAGDTAFFETQEDFVDYLTTKLAAMVSDLSWTETITAVSDGPDGWHLQVQTPSSDYRGVWFEGPGGIDPNFGQPTDADGAIISVLAADTLYVYRPMDTSNTGAGSVPRGYYGDVTPLLPGTGRTLAATFPERRIYLGGAASISSLTTAVSIAWKEYDGAPEVDETTTINATSVTSRYVDLQRSRLPSRLDYFHGFNATCLPEIRLGRTYTDGGSIWTAISAIVSAAPTELNAGSVPDLQSGDFDSTSWAELDEAWQPRIVRNRAFASFTSRDVAEWVREELKLAGYALGISATGTLAIFRLRRPVATEAGAVAIATTKVNDNLPTWTPDGAGLVNTLVVKRGYSDLEDDWTGPIARVRDVAAYGVSPRPRVMTIAPFSRCDPMETNAEIVQVGARVLGALGGDYAIVTCDVGLRHFDTTTPGAVVAITSPHLPDTSTGTRGVSALAGLVVGREIDIDNGQTSLTVYVPTSRAAGYVPSAKLTGNSLVSGNTYDLTCDTYTFDASTQADDWFIAGDQVRVFRWDSTTAGTLSGSVVSATGNVVRVTFDGAWTPGSDTWVLSYDVSNDAGLVSTQLAYVYLAASTGRIDAATDIDAWGFA